jgi:hypothetical protein
MLTWGAVNLAIAMNRSACPNFDLALSGLGSDDRKRADTKTLALSSNNNGK